MKQRALLQNVVAWCRLLASSAKADLLTLALHFKFDETPLRCRIAFPHSAVAVAESDVQVGKIHVVECQWSILLQLHGDVANHLQSAATGACTEMANSSPLLLQGAFSPQLRATDRATGEGISSMVRDCLVGLNAADLGSTFKMAMFTSEVDGAGANDRAIRVLKQTVFPQHWSSLTIQCLAHKIHILAVKTLKMNPCIVTGLKHVCLYMCGAGVRAHARQALDAIVEARLRFRPTSSHRLGEEASVHKDRCCSLFFQASSPKAAASSVLKLVKEFFNSDGRVQDGLTHCCFGCCANRAAAVCKAKALLRKLFSAVAPCHRFAMANWQEWGRAFAFTGMFTSLHGLLIDLLPSTMTLASGKKLTIHDSAGASGQKEKRTHWPWSHKETPVVEPGRPLLSDSGNQWLSPVALA